jgi:hypothetical protein
VYHLQTAAEGEEEPAEQGQAGAAATTGGTP